MGDARANFTLMELTLYFFTGGLAAILGSFANMLCYRLPRGLDTVRRPSFCPHCQHTLAARDLIPILSFVLRRGTCRYCRRAIGPRYLLVEIFSVAAAVTMLFFYGPSWQALTGFLLLWIGMILCLIDIEFQLLPDQLTLGFAAYALLAAGIQGQGASRLITAVCAAAFLFGMAWIAGKILKQEAMGGGDVKWMFAMGAVLGFPKILVGGFLGFVLGALLAIGAMIFLKKGRRDAIPFGPALIGGAWMAYFAGDIIWQWYWHGVLH